MSSEKIRDLKQFLVAAKSLSNSLNNFIDQVKSICNDYDKIHYLFSIELRHYEKDFLCLMETISYIENEIKKLSRHSLS